MHGHTDKFRQNLTMAAQSLADASTVPVFVTLPNANHVFINEAFQRVRGQSDESGVAGMHLVFSPESIQTLTEVGEGPSGATEAMLTVLREDATDYEANFRIVLMRDDVGQHLIFGTTTVDVSHAGFDSPTSQEISLALEDDFADSAEKQIALEKQVFRFAERSNFGLLVLDQKNLARYSNGTLERILGRSREQIIGKPLESIVRATAEDAFIRRVVDRLQSREGGSQTIEVNDPELGVREISFRWYPISGNPRATGVVVTDVTTRMIRQRTRSALASFTAASEVEEILRVARKALRTEAAILLTLSPSGDESLMIESLVDGSEINFPQSIDIKLANAVLPVARDYLAKHGALRHTHKLAAENVELGERNILLRPIEDPAGYVEGFLAVVLTPSPDSWTAYDEAISEFARRIAMRFESDRRASQIVEGRKRESLERLARGIAHDFNNVLMSIYGHLQLIERKIRKSDDLRLEKNVSHALQSARRGRQLVAAMIAFSENTTPTLQSVELGSVCEFALSATQNVLPDHFNIKLTIGSRATVLADAQTLANAVEALVLNARDAIASSSKSLEGEIGIDVSEGTDVDGKPVARIAISDNGSGMDEATRRQIFDPFFTTRDPGQGTGLGMAVVHATISRMQGRIEVRSKPHVGTQIILTFPRYGGFEEARPVRDTDSYKQSDTQRKRAQRAKHILVVDDSADQRALIRECLEEEGYTTEEAPNGNVAVDIARRRSQDFDLIIMDRLMPSLAGDDAARLIHEAQPSLPIVILSGYIDEATRAEMAELGVVRCLQKPVGIDDLIHTIDGILKRRERRDRRHHV